MKTINKFLLSTPIFLPLITLSCSASGPYHGEKDKIQSEIRQIYDKALAKFHNFAVRESFIPTTAKLNFNKIVKDGYIKFNQHFFETVDTSKKIHNWVKIQNKEEFNNIIIKRFQELNNNDAVYISDTEIKEEFQKMFLKNQDVYKLLENHDIYVKDDHSTFFGFSYIAPFEEGNSVVLNILDNVIPIVIPAQFFPYTTWAVFSLPKTKELKVKEINATPNKDEITKLEQFKQVLYNWYNTEYKKYYKD